MNVYTLLATAFLFGTIVMVCVTFFMGYLHWREERQQPASAPQFPKAGANKVRVPTAANDPGEIRKAS